MVTELASRAPHVTGPLLAFAGRRRLALTLLGVAIGAAIWLAIVVAAEPFAWGTLGSGHDARPYWAAAMADPYTNSGLGAYGAFLYAPAFLQLLEPLRALPWTVFLGAWTAVLLVAVAYLSGPVLFGPALVAVIPELWGGNVSLLIAVAVVLGFRWSASWSFVLLTKVTPGIGLLWFALRREWRALAGALVATALIGAVSYFLAPQAWRDWLGVLTGNLGRPIESGSFPLPFLVRAPLALVLLAWGALTDRRWTLPVTCLLALPVIWYGSLALLLGVLPLAIERSGRANALPGWRELRRSA